MNGTIVNAAAIAAGSLIGLILKKGISKRFEDSVNKALGLSVLLLGLNGVISSMFTAENGILSSSGTLLLIISLVVGVLAGEALKIEDRLNGLGDFLGAKLKQSDFSLGFVNASLIFCVGAMAIIGSVNDGLKGDSSVLYIKSLLDFTSAIILSATMGIGVIFSAVSVLLYQGLLTLSAGFIGPLLSDMLLNQICMVGYVLVMCIGINFLGLTKIKTANFLPALLIPPLVAVGSYLLHLFSIL